MLAHESIFFFVTPFLLLSYMLSGLEIQSALPPLEAMRSLAIKALLAIMPSLAALIFVAIYASPTASGVEAICRSWQSVYTSLSCTPLPAALEAMASMDNYIKMIRSSYHSFSIYKQWTGIIAYVLVLVAACLAPIVRDSSRRAVHKKRYTVTLASIIVLLAVTLFSAAFTLPLYAFAIDYGRWMSVYITLLVIFVIGHRSYLGGISLWLLPASFSDLNPSSLNQDTTAKYWAIPPLFFAALYTVPHCCMRFFDHIGVRHKLSVLVHIVAGNL